MGLLIRGMGWDANPPSTSQASLPGVDAPLEAPPGCAAEAPGRAVGTKRYLI
jgi:hypothetical protein